MTKVIGFARRENAAGGPSSVKHFGISSGCGGGDPMSRCRSMLTVRLWVSPLRRGSSEGLPAALTRRRDFNVPPIFGCILVESPRRLSVDVQHVVDHRR